MNFIDILKQYRDIFSFLFKCLILYVIWLILRKYIFYPESSIDHFLISQITHSTSLLLQIFGFSTYVDKTFVGIENYPGVSIAFNCNGLSLMYLFSSFIIAFTGKLKYKLVFIPLGIIAIHLFNIARTTVLAMLVVYKPEWTEFNHKYTFTTTIYILIFILWVIWVNYFSTLKRTKQ
ncbi:MAG: archaeosortase/exosortase family protein [Bacteroidia bacterium]